MDGFFFTVRFNQPYFFCQFDLALRLPCLGCLGTKSFYEFLGLLDFLLLLSSCCLQGFFSFLTRLQIEIIVPAAKYHPFRFEADNAMDLPVKEVPVMGHKDHGPLEIE